MQPCGAAAGAAGTGPDWPAQRGRRTPERSRERDAQDRTPQPGWQERAKPYSEIPTLGRDEPRMGAESGRVGPFLPRRRRRPVGDSAALPQPCCWLEIPQGHLQSGCCSLVVVLLLLPPANFAEGTSRRVVAVGVPATVTEPGTPACAVGPPHPRPFGSPPRRLPRLHAAAVYQRSGTAYRRPRRCCSAWGDRDGRRRLRCRLHWQPGASLPARQRPASRWRGQEALCGPRAAQHPAAAGRALWAGFVQFLAPGSGFPCPCCGVGPVWSSRASVKPF